MRSLSTVEIDELASRRGVRKEDGEDFLDAVGDARNEECALPNLYYDARLYKWNISTVRAIDAGIKSVYTDNAKNAGAVGDGNGIATPLPGAPYSLWPRRF